MARYSGPIVDVDIHHTWPSINDMLAYLPERWHDYVRGDGRNAPVFAPPASHVFALIDANGQKMDSIPKNGGRPGSDYELIRSQVLDPYSDDYRGVLTFNIGAEAGHLNPHLNAALCSAINDWNIDTWLQLDDRLYTCLLVSANNIEAAVAEIHRHGDNPQMVGILFPVNPMGRPLGDPVFDPIFAAAADHDLTVDLHVNTVDAGTINGGVGAPASYIEHSIRLSDPALHYVTSLISNGVFEKFPDLKFMIKEYGTAWLPHLIWKLDQSYDVLKIESPWVKKRPYDYIHSNIRFGTQPMEVTKDTAGRWGDLMAAIDGVDDILVFSSDYPHFQFDDPQAVTRLLPDAWLEKIMWKNSCEFFGWPVTERQPVGAPA